jgi:hypothetical protein
MIIDLDPIPSEARLDPMLRLGAGILLQAREDLQAPDPVTALDALEWTLSPEPCLTLEALGLDVDPAGVLVGFVKPGVAHGRKIKRGR